MKNSYIYTIAIIIIYNKIKIINTVYYGLYIYTTIYMWLNYSTIGY
jgi:hypothetical protein